MKRTPLPSAHLLPGIHHRCGLHRTLDKLARRQLTVGFIGGSITDSRSQNRWPDPVMAWFLQAWPEVSFTLENAAIGATGSPFAAIRAKRHLLDRGCDLVFVEFAVNDNGLETGLRNRTREGLIRQLLAGEGRDVVIVYTFCQPMYDDMAAGRVPPTIAEFEAIAHHYGIGTVWMGLHALNEVRAGRMRWDQWLPDGLHPQERGSQSYADAVTTYLRHELEAPPLAQPLPTGANLPAPLFAGNWETARELPFDQVETAGPWLLKRAYTNVFAEYILSTVCPGATLSFSFQGTGLALVFDFGKRSGEFRYRLDGGDWVEESRERPVWVGNEGWCRISPLAEGLPPGTHRLELEVTHGGANAGTNFDLISIGVI